MSKQEVFSDKVEPVELFSVEFVDVDNKLSMLDDEEELKGRALTDFSTFMRAASILSHFLLLHFDLSFLEKKIIFEKMTGALQTIKTKCNLHQPIQCNLMQFCDSIRLNPLQKLILLFQSEPTPLGVLALKIEVPFKI